jgi:hypothetical protein
MIKKQFIFLFLIALFFSNFGNSQNLESKIDNLYQVKEEAPGFSVAVFKGDKIILEKQYGIANLDYNIPITSETVFDIGSIAKQFTAAAILLLEYQGKLSIKEPAYKYIENLPRYKKGNPTIEQLLNQTSGIKEVDPYLEVCDIHWRDYIRHSMLVNIITNIDELNFTPGEYFYYTNANYILLASIIEKVSKMSFEDYLQKNLFEPLNMKHTILNIDVFRIIPNRAIGYTEDEGQIYKTHLYGLYFAGDGQIITNPEDMFQWHQNIKNSTIGTPAIWKKMCTKAKLNDGTIINFGLGVEFETHNGYKAMGFDGMIKSGFVSKYLYFAELDIAFFTTQNTFDWDFTERFFQLVDLYIQPKITSNIKTTKQTYKAIILKTRELKQYEGKYLFFNNENHQEREIKLYNDKLFYQTFEGEKIGELIPVGNHEFVYLEDKDSQSRIQFEFNQDEKQFSFDNRDGDNPKLFKAFVPYEHSNKELFDYVGTYYNKDLQIAKEIKVDNGVLMFYYRNGAWKTEITSISKDLFNTQQAEIQFVRNNKGKITRCIIMGLNFEKK